MNRMDQNLAEFAGRCRGSLLGTAFGDALGLPVEGLSAQQIEQTYGRVDDFLPGQWGSGRTSDDTQMTLATGFSLVRRGGVEGADCARSCAELFEQERGYGRSAQQVLTALNSGHDYRKTGRLLFPQGSFGNGAAMRIAPVGLFYGDLTVAELRPLVYEAVRATHVHDEAIDAALLVAVLVGRFSRLRKDAGVDGEALLHELAGYCLDPAMRSKLALAEALLSSSVDNRTAAEQIGCGVRGSESVVLALFLVCRHLDDAVSAVVNAVACGGDTDTIAAMVGAVLGARHGDQVFPPQWHAGLERGGSGYDGLTQIAEELGSTAYNKGFFVDFSV